MDIEDIHQKVHSYEHLKYRSNFLDFYQKFPEIDSLCLELISLDFKNNQEFSKNKIKLEGKYKYDRIKNTILIYVLKKFYQEKKITRTKYDTFLEVLKTKNVRSLSGILEVALMTSPWNMAGTNDGCDNDCYFCPKTKGLARSYIKEEPAVRRALQNNFHTVEQFRDRISTYVSNGHDADKLEIIVLGGTWSSYEYTYQKDFARDVFYAANTFFQIEKREKKSLREEQKENETAWCKIIGFTIETRPDKITEEEILRLLELGITRVQIGVQTTHDFLLKKINRGCLDVDTRRAIRLLKKYGFKILIHMMPNLPGSNPNLDKESMDSIMFDSEYQVDEIKIYPTSVTTTSDKDTEKVHTVIEKWYQEGKYVPYDQKYIYDLLYYVKENMPEYMRISRIFRDIPVANITAGAKIPNMRQVIQRQMAEEGKYCACIRCREIKNTNFELEELEYRTVQYPASGGTEYFISANLPSSKENPYLNTLVGFLRLRINSPEENYSLDSLEDSSIVRELHVYGKMTNTYLGKSKKTSGSQHRGIGKKLLQIAETITRKHNLKIINVISGVGVREYYKKRGYQFKNGYMRKNLFLVEWNLEFLKICIYLPVIFLVGLIGMDIINSQMSY